MFTKFFKSDLRIKELRARSGGVLVERFAEELFKAGYAKITARLHIRTAEHLMYWIARKGIDCTALNQDYVEGFRRHLAQCRCTGFGHARRQYLKNGARLFVAHLHGQSVSIRSTTVPPVEDPSLVVEFCQWMREQRGTSDQTLHRHSITIRQLLDRLGEDPKQFDARNLRNFVLEKNQLGWAAAKKRTTAIRMFLRFLMAEGKCPVGLDASIPGLAHWRLSSLPQYLQEDEVDRVIACCDLTTQTGRRDYAIILLLARLGFRAGDIVHLRLCDIDWKQAWIYVSGKGRRQTRLPLTQEIGNAVASYINDGRPQGSTRCVFLRARAPFCSLTSAAISMLVAKAMSRAGVKCPSRGAAHVLRHSLATSMLRHGASLQEIASILRHRSIATTQIYAKVDFTALREIAQPWPEVEVC